MIIDGLDPVTPITPQEACDNQDAFNESRYVQLLLQEHVTIISEKICKALPPWAEEERIKKSILSDESIKNALGEEIVSIEKDLERNVYIVHGDSNSLVVQVNYQPCDRIGPRPFTLEVISE